MELLKQLYSIHSQSGKEQKMTEFISKKCVEFGARTMTDETGNLYAVKGECVSYPCIVAHTDQVQREHSGDFTTVRAGDVILGYSPSNKRQEGLGADDKNGIWIALKCLEAFDVVKCAFFPGEEIGCVGSSQANMDFFDDCRHVLQCDRRGGYDLITSIGGVELCSREFLDAINYKDFGYNITSGMMTDVETLKCAGLGVSCVNMSCGYYNPHSDKEVTDLCELQNTLDFVSHIVESCTHTYKHEYQAPNYDMYDWYDDYYYRGGWKPHNVASKCYNGTLDFDNQVSYDEEVAWAYDLIWEYVCDSARPTFKDFWRSCRNSFTHLKKSDLKAIYKEQFA